MPIVIILIIAIIVVVVVVKRKKNEKDDVSKDELKPKIEQSPLMLQLVEMIKNSDDNFSGWIFHAIDYYDTCQRYVAVSAHDLVIRYSTSETVTYYDNVSNSQKTKRVEKVIKSICINFTDLGYSPLTSFTDSHGNTISLQKVTNCFCEVLETSLTEFMPNCDFNNYIKNYSARNCGFDEFADGTCVPVIASMFEYRVPKVETQSAF